MPADNLPAESDSEPESSQADNLPAEPEPESEPETSQSSQTSDPKSSRFMSTDWAVAGSLVLACLSTGMWAVPQIQNAQQLQNGSDSSYSVPVASAVVTPSASELLNSGDLDSQLNEIASSFSAGNISGIVADATSGEVLYSRNADKPRVPASNFKILTDYTLMRHSNSADRYITSVTQKDTTLTLLAGGDTLLSTGKSDDSLVVGRAGLRTLAEETIGSLKDSEEKKFTLNLDTSLYSGPAINSAWAQEDIDAGFVNNVAPLAFYSHYSPGENGRVTSTRPTDPAGQVHKALLADLNKLGADKGLTFTLGEKKESDDDAATIGAVESATVSEQAAYMMQESDNMLAEVLGRNAAIAAGEEGSEQSAKDLVRRTLEADGISVEGLNQVDLCGLSLENKVKPQTLLEITRAVVTGENGADTSLAGFPIAGGSGTLENRFDNDTEAAARGYARAKTGTLNKVIALTGYTERDNGQVLIYSFITNDVSDTSAAKNTVDRSVAVVTHQTD